MKTQPTDTTPWPPHKYALATIQDNLTYGAVIEMDLIKQLFGPGYNDPDTWEFRGEFIKLRQAMEALGYFTTERGQEGEGLRVLTREEMAGHVKRVEMRKANDSLTKSVTLSRVPRKGLTEQKIKELDHWENKAALIGATAKVLLRKRNLPSPEMAVKSIRQLSTTVSQP